MLTPFFTVVTPTFNRADLLDKYLESICAQDLHDSFHVIIADNNSTDRTQQVIKRYQEKYDFVQSIVETKQGTSSAKNSAVRLAQGPYLVFFDDDVIVPPNHLSNAFGIIQRNLPDIVAGPVFPYYTVRKPWWFKDSYEIKKFENKSDFSLRCRVTGANWIIKRDLFDQLGGFDPRLGPSGMNSDGEYIVDLNGDERKLLDLYRARTPLASQKVYYALECPVQHCVAPYKLRLRHHLRRMYTAGRTMAFITVDVRGAPFKRKDLWAMSRNLLPNFVRRLFLQIRSHGSEPVDVVEPFAMASYEVGMILEGFRKHPMAS